MATNMKDSNALPCSWLIPKTSGRVSVVLASSPPGKREEYNFFTQNGTAVNEQLLIIFNKPRVSCG